MHVVIDRLFEREELTQMMIRWPERSFVPTKERSDKTFLARLNRAADVMGYECNGLMFWFTRKKFVGSYLDFKATRRS